MMQRNLNLNFFLYFIGKIKMRQTYTLLLLLCLFQTHLFAQTYKFKSVGLHINRTGTDGSADIEFVTPLLIEINDNKIVISGEKNMTYRISTIDTSYINVNRDRIIEGKAVNRNGIKCKFHCDIFSKNSKTIKADGILGGLVIIFKTLI
jgi:hypothetical protein